jgi:hypothetical protein
MLLHNAFLMLRSIVSLCMKRKFDRRPNLLERAPGLWARLVDARGWLSSPADGSFFTDLDTLGVGPALSKYITLYIDL